MTITLSPEAENLLNEAAARQGMGATTFVQVLVEEKLRLITNGGTIPHQQSTLDEFESTLDELAALGSYLSPADSAVTYSREMIYADHD